jgi:2-dehydro-3-deoxyphosphogluconate aldolase/(4S)-4-hydroxy-2-oxoglutarate aldolase
MVMLRDLLQRVRSVPVCVFDETEGALKTAELLLKHGVNVIEITLRTENAFNCIRAVKNEFKDAIVGAGSVLKTADFEKAAEYGAVFAVSPCFDESLCEAAVEKKIPYIPGVSTPSELYKALKYSDLIKIFPASALGGVEYINAISAPFKMFSFGLIPTGGIDNKNFKEYLAVEKVVACGLSYPVSDKLVKEKKFDMIEERIKEIYGSPL